MEQIITKVCDICGTEKNIQDFEKNRKICKKCRNLQVIQWHRKNAEKVREQARERYKKDPQKYLERNKKYLSKEGNKEKRSESAKEWCRVNKDKRRDYYYKKLYGISLFEFDLLYEKQKGQCAICCEQKNKKDLCVDHNHGNGNVRGLLCGKCNFGLGNFQDNISILEKAITYLETGIML